MAYNLRALLEDAKFCSSLTGFNVNNSNNVGKLELANGLQSQTQLPTHKTLPTAKYGEMGYDGSNASLQRNDVWGANDSDDFDLEYMDLDEFLNETGLVDTNFNSLANSSPQPSSENITPQSTPIPTMSPPQNMQQSRVQHKSIEELLMRGSCALTSPAPSISPITSPTSDRHQDTAVSQHRPSQDTAVAVSQHRPSQDTAVAVSQHRPSQDTAVGQHRPPQDTAVGQHSPQSDDSSVNSKHDRATSVPASDEVPANSTDIIKKRKYSEDGEGLTETSVVVVPGREGFDPSNVKFAPEELQPQPIIKKSKKQFVPDDNKDEKYWKRRNKNNVAAKRSREARRAKENQIIMRAGFLETENEKLTTENTRLLEENEKLRELVKQLQRA